MKTLTIGSRRSLLAQAQTNLIRDMLLAAWPDLTVNIILIDTQGDRNRHDPLPKIGGKGLFTAELETSLHEGRIDLAVHSLKDLPVEDSPGLTVVAIPKRAAAGDMLISSKATKVEDLPRNAVVGTSSLRRAAQILAIRPDVRIKDIRGNIDTRLRKVTEAELGYEATLLAQAGLERLGYTAFPYAHPIPYRVMLPAPGQGALAVQGRAADTEINTYLLALDHAPTRAAVTAERAFLAGLGGGCSLPVGALAQVTEEYLTLEALVAAPDGQRLIRVNGQSSSTLAEELGQNLAHEALQKGAKQLLATIG